MTMLTAASFELVWDYLVLLFLKLDASVEEPHAVDALFLSQP